MNISLHNNKEYTQWLTAVKQKIQQAQIKAAVKVNTELLLVYWDLGKEMIEKQQNPSWGDALIPQLSNDLTAAFPGMKGFSSRNLFYVRKGVIFYSNPAIIPQLVGQLLSGDDQQQKQPNEFVQQVVAQLPWGHHIAIMDKYKTIEQAIFYFQHTLQYNWSRAVLIHQMDCHYCNRSFRSDWISYPVEYA